MMGTPPRSQLEGLPHGCEVRPLAMHGDERGTFTELHRQSWRTGVVPVQWNLVSSEATVLRGVHVHVLHDDYLVVARGRATVGLCDLREESPTYLHSAVVELDGGTLRAIVIPHGVAHGFYFHVPSVHVYAVTRDYDPADELGCRWDDPGLGLRWPGPRPLLSERDSDLPPLHALLSTLRERRAARASP